MHTHRSHGPAPLTCRRCRAQVTPELRPREMSSGGRHLGAYCPRCHGWLRWLSQSPKRSILGDMIADRLIENVLALMDEFYSQRPSTRKTSTANPTDGGQ